MASPFTIFRRHQKAALAVLGVVIMIAFTILPVTLQLMERRGYENPVVVRTAKFGSLHASEVQTLLFRRNRVRTFLDMVQAAVMRTPIGESDSKDPKNFERLLLKERERRSQVMLVEQAKWMIGPATEQAVVDKWLLENQAKQMGIVVSDQMVNEFLKHVAGERVYNELPRLLADPQMMKESMSQAQLFGLLQSELMALRLRELFYQDQPGMANLFTRSMPPGERWEYYKRLEQRATAEVAAIPVAQYTSQVLEPSQAELKDFFEKHKDREQDPQSPEFGFRVPQKIDVQFFKAEYSKFLARVTDEEVKEQYEKDPELYERQESPPPEPEAKPQAKTDAKTAPEKKTAAEPKIGAEAKTGAEKKTEPEKKAETAAKTEPEKKTEAEKKTEPEKQAEGQKTPEAEKKTEAKPEPEKKTEPEKKEGEKPAPGAKSEKSSSVKADSPFRLVSFAEEAKNTETQKTTEGTKTAPEAKTAEEKPAIGEKKPAEEAKPAEKKTVEEKKTAEEAKPAEKTSEAAPEPPRKPEVPETPRKPESPKDAQPSKEGPEAKGGMSRQTKERIRDKLAKDKMDKALAGVEEELRLYRIAWTSWDAERTANPDAVMPPPPDFAALAAKYQLTQGATGLVSAVASQALEIGRSAVPVQSGQRENTTVPFIRYAFLELKNLFDPVKSVDSNDNQYVFWKTKNEPGRVPTYDEAKDEVLQAWRLKEARTQFALPRAKELQEKAEKAKMPLKEVFRGEAKVARVALTGEFSWLPGRNLSLDSSGQELKVSDVDGTTAVGPEFMRTVFGLSPGQIGVAMNRPQNDVYVVRMITLTPEKKLLEDFEKELSTHRDRMFDYEQVGGPKQKQISDAWMEEIRKAAGYQLEQPLHESQRTYGEE